MKPCVRYIFRSFSSERSVAASLEDYINEGEMENGKTVILSGVRTPFGKLGEI